MAFRTIHFITGNKNKLNELRAGFVARNVTDIDLQTKAIDLPEIQGTVEAIARDKCTRAAREVESSLIYVYCTIVRTLNFYNRSKARF